MISACIGDVVGCEGQLRAGTYFLCKPYIQKGPWLNYVGKETIGEVPVDHIVQRRIRVHCRRIPCGIITFSIIVAKRLDCEIILVLIFEGVCPCVAVLIQINGASALVPDDLKGGSEYQPQLRNMGDETDACVDSVLDATATCGQDRCVLVSLAAEGCTLCLSGPFNMEPSSVDINRGLDCLSR